MRHAQSVFQQTAMVEVNPASSETGGTLITSHIHFINGGGERVRTDGLLRARQALSQLSYTPITGGPNWT